MNFWKLSLAAAACASAFAGGAAHAAISLPNSGNGELVLTAWDDKGTVDTADDTSYSRDLGLVINGFASAATNPVLVSTMQQSSTLLTFGPDATLSGWLSGVASGDRSRIRWNVVGGDSAGDQRLVTTVAAGETVASNNSILIGTNTNVATFFSALNSSPTHNSLPNGSAVNVFSDNVAYGGGTSWGDKLGGKTSFITSAGMGASLNWWLLDQNGAPNGNQVNKFQFQVDAQTPMQWTFANDGTLTYAPTAPIPEPGTWAMMLAGLAGLGLASRRRAR